MAELRHLTRTTVSATTDRPPERLAELPGIHDVRVDDGRVSFDVDSENLEDAIRRLTELGLRSLSSHPPTLEDLFLRHYDEELTEAGVEQNER